MICVGRDTMGNRHFDQLDAHPRIDLHDSEFAAAIDSDWPQDRQRAARCLQRVLDEDRSGEAEVNLVVAGASATSSHGCLTVMRRDRIRELHSPLTPLPPSVVVTRMVFFALAAPASSDASIADAIATPIRVERERNE